MACSSPILVSSTSYIEWTPCGTAAVNTNVRVYFTATTAAAIAGTFKIQINGKSTAAITYSSVIATLVASVATALLATWPSTPLYVAADAVGEAGTLSITASQVGYNNIKIIVAGDTGLSTITATARVRYMVVGTQTYILSLIHI